MAMCQHDMKLESLFKEDHVKRQRQKLFVTEASKLSLQFFVCGWRHLIIYTSKNPKILTIVQCTVKAKEVPGLGKISLTQPRFVWQISHASVFPYCLFTTSLEVLGLLRR